MALLAGHANAYALPRDSSMTENYEKMKSGEFRTCHWKWGLQARGNTTICSVFQSPVFGVSYGRFKNRSTFSVGAKKDSGKKNNNGVNY